MKTSIVYTIIALLMINSLSGQVKIGNNPESLNSASVLELESTTRVLVITRVTDAQMNVINPLPGALVYNTDQDCLHYHDGSRWINICEELDNSFTVSTRADYFNTINPAQSKDDTVVITQTENPDGSINYNFEVGLIRGANIVNETINGDSKLQNGSVTRDKLADKSVTLRKLADATTGQPGDLFQWNGLEWTLINESSLGITEKDSIVGNEYNTGSAIAAGIITITDGGGDQNVNLISGDPDNDIIAGSDGALFLNETDDQTVTDFSIVGTDLSITLEDGNTATVPLADIAAAIDTDDQALSLAAGNILTLEDGGTVNLTPFLDNTDDQTITAFTLDNTTNELTLTLEDGGTQTVDFSTVLAAAGTDDQALSLTAGNTLTLEDGGTVNLTPFMDNTDDQTITAFSLDNTTNELTLTLEDGGTQTVDFSTVLAAAGTDDQTLSLAAGNILTLEDGGTVNLTPFLDNTDDQTITAFTLDNTTNELTLTLEDGGTQTVDFSTVLAAAGTDNQALSLTAGNILTLEDGGTVNLTPFMDNTDDQTITAFTLDNTTNELTLTLEDGGTQTVDFSTVLAAAGTDDQALSLTAGNILTLEDGGTVNLTPFDETVSEGEGITVTPSGEDFEVAVTNPVVAMGKVNIDATTVNATGLATPVAGTGVARNSLGNYTVTFDPPRPDADYIVQLTLLGAGPDVTIEVIGAPSTTEFIVQISQLSAPVSPGPLSTTPIDAQWYFTVTDF